jgi:ligand-binding SRPBCC domain-containing protein
MKEFTYHTELWLRRPLDEVFTFFAEARNLEIITPPWLSIEVLTPAPITMRAGALIDYRIRVHQVPIRWRTEITEWHPPHRFVDVQLRGPYTLWHHTHTFEERGGGTLCVDDVRYRPRGGVLINWLFVRRDVKSIFAFRDERLADIFRANSASIRFPMAERMHRAHEPR